MSDQTGMVMPKIGDIWKHFKGTEYVVTGFSLGCDSELVVRVHYREAQYPLARVWSRGLANFLGPVDDRAKARFSLSG